MIVLALLVGQKIALPVFLGAYLWGWAGYSGRVALVYAFCGWGFVVGFYDRTMGLLFHSSWLASRLQSTLPGWIPEWLIF
jgi:hypothetical protein